MFIFFLYINRDIKPSVFITELEKGKKPAVFLMQRLPHIIPFSEVTKYIYPALILFEQANFIDLINFCYILWVVYTIDIDIVL